MTKYFHGGKAGLPIGGYILPASETGYSRLDKDLKKRYGEYDADVYDMNLVYTTSQVEWAIPYAIACSGWVYEVDPEGELLPEQDELGLDTGLRCSRARISRVTISPSRMARVTSMLRSGRTRPTVMFEC
jgi:hypothetical protein